MDRLPLPDGAEPPFVRMTVAEYIALPEYSASIPTGQYPGKVWRRHHRYTLDGRTTRVVLLIGRYHSLRKEAGRRGEPVETIATTFTHVRFQVKAGSAPCAWPL